jgi:hypothetical protein
VSGRGRCPATIQTTAPQVFLHEFSILKGRSVPFVVKAASFDFSAAKASSFDNDAAFENDESPGLLARTIDAARTIAGHSVAIQASCRIPRESWAGLREIA